MQERIDKKAYIETLKSIAVNIQDEWDLVDLRWYLAGVHKAHNDSNYLATLEMWETMSVKEIKRFLLDRTF